jgi:hypothetical protein
MHAGRFTNVRLSINLGKTYMSQVKNNGLLQSNLSNYEFDTSKFIVLKPLNPIHSSNTAKIARKSEKQLPVTKVKLNA